MQENPTPQYEAHEQEAYESERSVMPKLIFWASAGVVVLAFAALLIATLITWSQQIVWVNGENSIIDYPVKGQQAILADVETYWIRQQGESGALDDATFLPVAVLKAHKKSGPARLRMFYVNDQGNLMGDPISEDVQNGSFSASPRYTFVSEEGLDKESDFNAYLTEQTSLWYLTILEGPQGSESVSDFSELVRIPIGRTIKKN